MLFRSPIIYDKVYYVGEQDFYVPRDANGKFKKFGSPGEAYEETVAVMKTLSAPPTTP